MPITEIKQVARLSADDIFWNDVVKPAAFVATRDRLFASGEWIHTVSLSEDGLVQTRTDVYQTLEVLSEVYTAIDIELKNLFRAHKIATNQYAYSPHTIDGFSGPFTVTSIYTFPADQIDIVTQIASGHRAMDATGASVQVATATSLTVLNKYTDSADYQDRHIDSLPEFVADNAAEILAAGCVRTITFTLD